MSEETAKVKKPRAAKATAPAAILHPALEKKEDGSVNWRKIVGPSKILLNWDYFAARGIDIKTLEEEEVNKHKETVDDEGVIISLAGIRELAAARGVKSVIYDLVHRTDDIASVKCTITFLPSEDCPYEKVNCGMANASRLNTTENYFVHAEAIAENRAFSRAIRAELRISSVSSEEINPLEKKAEVVTQSPIPQQTLRNQMEELGVEIPDLVKIIKDKGYSFGRKGEPWDENLFSLSGPACFSLITDIKNYKK